MKNKKLFAILTLVCFMFTLMPVAAFAAETYVYDSEQVYVTGTKGSVTDEDTEATVAPKAPFYAYVGSADGKSVTSSNYVFYVIDEDGEYVDVALGGEFAGFKVEGDYTVYAINVEEDAAKVKTDVLDKIASVESKVDTIKAWAGANNLVSGDAVVTVEDAADYEYEIKLAPYVKASEGYKAENSKLVEAKDADKKVIPGEWTMTIAANDGFKKDGAVVATLEKYAVDKDGKEIKDTRAVVKNVELKISEAGYVDVAYDTLKTNNKGQVVFEVTADYANKGNKVIVKYDDAKATLTVDATNGKAASVVLNNEPAAPQNNENSVEKANVEFKFADVNGVAVDYVGYGYTIPKGEVEFTLVEKPAKSNMKADNFALVKEYNPGTSIDTDGVYTLTYKDGAQVEFDKDGTYVIKVALENGSSATATVKVAEMGDVVNIMFVKGDKTVAYGDSAFAGAVVAVDAKGVTEVVTPDELSASGLAVEKFYAVADGKIPAGTVKIEKDDEHIGSTVTVMAVYDDFTATTTLTVVDKAATIAYLSNTAEVGISTKLTGMIKDADGKVSNVAGVKNVKAIVLEKPENAVATANAVYDATNKVVSLTFLASAPGEYKVQTIATYGDNNTYVSGIETITVAGGVNAFKDVVVVSMGANSMIVNNELVKLDVAPFIENNRTMMQFNVLYVFGIDVEWVAETQSIVAEGNGLKVVMQLGSKVATVNGAEVALDVAPYSVNGRTVVPVGFITGVLDITPTFTYNADGSIADILFTK